MKNLTFSLVIATCSSVAFAQSFDVIGLEGNVVSGTTVEMWADTGSIIAAEFNVKNKSNASKEVKLKKVEQVIVPGAQNYYCWDVCYGFPAPDLAGTLTVDANGVTEGLHLMADYNPLGNLGVSSIMYVFFDESTPSDTAYVIVNYHATAVGITERSIQEKNSISNAFPNPSSSFFSLNYKMENDAQTGKIRIHNMLGAVVKELELMDKQGTLIIPTSSLSSGLYFYSFLVGNDVVSTKRLTVAH